MTTEKHTTSSLIPFAMRYVGSKSVETVDGRDIHIFLGVSRDYSDWVKRQIKSGQLIENKDFTVFYNHVENPKGGRPSTEYFFTFRAAEHLGMMSRTAKGKEIREYFIDLEEKIHGNKTPQVRDPAIQMLINMAVELDEARTIATAAKTIAQHAIDVQQWLTIREYCFLEHLEHQMPPSFQQEYGKYLTAYCQEYGIPIRNQGVADRRYGTEHAYHVGTIAHTLPGWLMRRYDQPILAIVPKASRGETCQEEGVAYIPTRRRAIKKAHV